MIQDLSSVLPDGWYLFESGSVPIKIYDMIGQEVTTLFSGNSKAGIYSLNRDGIDSNGNRLSSRCYVLRMTAGGFVQSVDTCWHPPEYLSYI